MNTNTNTKNLFISAFILGLGFMGSLDGIVFHQFLQWHHVIDHQNHRIELFSDGVFNLVVTLLLVFACIKIFRDALHNRIGFSWRIFIGSIIVGAGSFNLFEGLIDHQILGLHHVRSNSPNWFIYDIGYLISGVLLIIIGTIYLNLKMQFRQRER
ncbi:DUF2243 domain-containing protein [Paenibacillus psychroresistens]|uniref:DUF2243 domain-containing protein n=1 Tax=Paenibacillus psychroresistens TaxID=1778678 RepID=A0A6B8RI62_9BACL|nr:DUF2243 domain-containing protein [Paenibacillus psychroresistens]QGQ95223.1 DUF2243 domain-containing protein [Paenibacillus psychroresistens]